MLCTRVLFSELSQTDAKALVHALEGILLEGCSSELGTIEVGVK
jgi:hypothetical protein